MENVKKTTNDNTKVPTPNHTFEKKKAYQDFINVLSQIIEKNGADILGEINRTTKKVLCVDVFQ